MCLITCTMTEQFHRKVNAKTVCGLVLWLLTILIASHPALAFSALKYHEGWYFMLGDDVGNQHSTVTVDTNLRLPTFENETAKLSPGSRANSAVWVDKYGDMFMFGGAGFDGEPTEDSHLLNDLWFWNTTSSSWMVKLWVQSGDLVEKTGQRAMPQRRQGASACGVEGLVFVLFGGKGPNGIYLYDTWIFTIADSSWLPLYLHHGTNKTSVVHPAGRTDAATWCKGDKMVIFGGTGEGSVALDDMWEFSLRTLTWHSLSWHVDLGTLSTTQSTADEMFPIARSGAMTWTGTGATFYMYGGKRHGYSTMDASGMHVPLSSLLSDLWVYFPSNGSWILLHPGNLKSNIKGQECPGPREAAVGWVDPVLPYNLWMFGGNGMVDSAHAATTNQSSLLADLWCFSLETNRWYSTSLDPPTAPSSIAKSKPTKHITPRSKSQVWSSQDVKFLFGGFGIDGRGKLSYLNDLWVLGTPNSSLPKFLQPITRKMSPDPAYRLSPVTTFLVCLATVAGIVMTAGAGFCLKKFLVDYPRHHPTKEYNVKYSVLQEDGAVDFDT